MSLLQAIFLGFIQGLTEFLPVSSSGHLAIAQAIFHIDTDTGLLYDVLLHFGTLIAIFLVFYKDIFRMIIEGCSILKDAGQNIFIFFRRMSTKEDISYIHIIRNGYRKFVMLVLVSTIPTGIIGIVAADVVLAASEILIVPGICLIITGVLLLLADRIPEGNKTPGQITYSTAFLVGIFQGIATLPGLSRSGTTITACLFSGYQRKFAVKYSFIMSIPAIIGATLLQLKDVTASSLSAMDIVTYIIGMAVAAVVGYICIKTMLVIVKKRKFTYFAIYCFIIGLIAIGGYFFIG